MTVINPETGETATANLFVSAIGTSGYPYVEAFPTKEKDNWIRAHINAFRYYGGLPLILVPDNDKSAVILANRYDRLHLDLLRVNQARMAYLCGFEGCFVACALLVRQK